MYDILLGGQAVGRAWAEKEGLYYRFECRCDLSGETVYRVTVRCGEVTENLGILVPEGGSFVARSRVPVKKLGQGPLEFKAVPRHTQLEGKFIPLSPEEPFKYLKRLQNAVLRVKNGQVGIVVEE